MNNDQSNDSQEDSKLTDSKNIGILFIGLHVIGAFLSSIGGIAEDLIENFRSEQVLDAKRRIAISDQRVLYEEFGKNPLHAWKAIQLRNEFNFEEMPQWALVVILASANNLVSLGSSDVTINSSLKQAMGIDGHKVSQFQDNMFWLEVFHETYVLIDKGMAQKDAFYKIAKKHRGKAGSEATVEKRYFEFRSKLKDVPLPHPFDL